MEESVFLSDDNPNVKLKILLDFQGDVHLSLYRKGRETLCFRACVPP